MDRDFFIDRAARAIVKLGWGSLSDGEVEAMKEDSYYAAVMSRVEELRPRPAIATERQSIPVYEAKRFDTTCRIVVPDFSAINDELIAYLAQHPEYLHKLNWRRFEELVGRIFENQGYDVELGPGRGDGGVDLRLVSKDSIGTLVTLVQAKKYSRRKKIGLEAVSALHGLLDSNKAHRGVLVTTSEFLPSARRFAEKQSFRLRLANEGDLIQWLREISRKNHARRNR